MPKRDIINGTLKKLELQLISSLGYNPLYGTAELILKFCEEMVSRKPYEESCYSRNLTNVAQHFEMNEKGAFGKSGAGKNVWLIESDSPMDSAMFFIRS